MSLEAKRRYRERNREKLRAAGREYAARKRREAGMPALGTPESTENRRNARKAFGSEHGNWRGEAVGYGALHKRVERHKTRTGTCEWCGATPEPKSRTVGTEWANVSREYRRELSDWAELCASCHRKYDMTDEKRRKVGDAARGRVVSAETREKLRITTTRRWEKSRAA